MSVLYSLIDSHKASLCKYFSHSSEQTFISIDYPFSRPLKPNSSHRGKAKKKDPLAACLDSTHLLPGELPFFPRALGGFSLIRMRY